MKATQTVCQIDFHSAKSVGGTCGNVFKRENKVYNINLMNADECE